MSIYWLPHLQVYMQERYQLGSEFVTTTGTNWGTMAAVALVSMLPALLFLFLVQRHIVAGLTFGAVKG